MNDFIPYSMPDIGDEEIEAVVKALRSGWVTTGPEASAFEGEFAAFIGDDVHAVAVNSATAGLHLALEACGVAAGDEVIVPTWTFTASAEVVRYLGAIPVVVDVDRESLNLDIEAMRSALTARTKAVIVVHLGGLSMDMSLVHAALADRPDIRIIEDAAHALPAVTGGVVVGSSRHSNATVFSFYANKTMTTGEGGMVTTRDPEIAARIRIMRLHGIDRDVFDRYSSTKPSWAYDVVAPGYKYNLTDPAAAMGRVQLRRAQAMRDRRQEIAQYYNAALADLDLTLPAGAREGDTHAWHLYMIRLSENAPVTRDRFIELMSQQGIGCSVHFIPLHMHSYWKNSLALTDADFPVASTEYHRAVSLPIFSRMSDAQVSRVAETVRSLLTS